ncbi:MAG: (2Fe-2S)-binding protein [Burkholderiaceae bacterium]
MSMQDKVPIKFQINDRKIEAEVPARLLAVDFIRSDLGLTGTHVGCEHGVCGACTVVIDGVAMRTCLEFAARLDGRCVRTVESLAGTDGRLSALQQSFRKHHALQCGFCTPGILMSAVALLDENPHPDAEEIREIVAGHICRCTGYVPIVEAILDYVRQAGGGHDR